MAQVNKLASSDLPNFDKTSYFRKTKVTKVHSQGDRKEGINYVFIVNIFKEYLCSLIWLHMVGDFCTLF